MAVISNEEFARISGKSLAEIEEMIREAEEDDFPPGCLDPGTLNVHIKSPETYRRMREVLIAAGGDPADRNL